MAECPICYEKFNKTNHLKISCPYCESTGCSSCYRQYILNEKNTTCFNKEKKDGEYVCQKNWERSFVVRNFPKSWVRKEWTRMIKNKYFEMEKALLPETQLIIKNEEYIASLEEDVNYYYSELHILNLNFRLLIEMARNKPSPSLAKNLKYNIINNITKHLKLKKKLSTEKRQNMKLETIDYLIESIMNIKKEEIKEEKSYYHSLYAFMRKVTSIYSEGVFEIPETKMNDRDLNNIHKEVRKAIRDMYAIIRNTRIMILNGGNVIQNNTRKFIGRKCAEENCRGFLDEEWKCGLCNAITCKHCLHVVEHDHECDADDIKTADLLKNSTKPCPKCHVSIYKIDGCDQMWCTQCHVAFSWNTGNIETKIHNPHYYQWLRETRGTVPRNPGDNPGCRRGITRRELRTIARTFNTRTEETIKLYKIIFNNTQLINSQMETYRPDENVDNVKYRKQFLKNEIDEKKFKTMILANYKKNDKKRDIYAVLELYTAGIRDMILETTNTTSEKNSEFMNELFGRMENLNVYCNEILKEISITYGVKSYKILFDTKEENTHLDEWRI